MEETTKNVEELKIDEVLKKVIQNEFEETGEGMRQEAKKTN